MCLFVPGYLLFPWLFPLCIYTLIFSPVFCWFVSVECQFDAYLMSHLIPWLVVVRSSLSLKEESFLLYSLCDWVLHQHQIITEEKKTKNKDGPAERGTHFTGVRDWPSVPVKLDLGGMRFSSSPPRSPLTSEGIVATVGLPLLLSTWTKTGVLPFSLGVQEPTHPYRLQASEPPHCCRFQSLEPSSFLEFHTALFRFVFQLYAAVFRLLFWLPGVSFMLRFQCPVTP